MMLATLTRHPWTSADYERMRAAGLFEKIDLLCGDVVITGATVRPYHWTLDNYEQLVALGLLDGKILFQLALPRTASPTSRGAGSPLSRT